MVVRLAYVSQRWERTNVNQGMTLGSYSSERATNLCIVSVWHVMNWRLRLIACCVWYNMVLYDIIQQHFLRNAIMHNNTFGIIQCQLVSLINFSHCLWGFHFQSGKPTWHGHGICQQPFFFLFSILVVSSGSLSLKLSYYNTQSVSQMQFMLQQGVWASWCSNKLIHINARTYGGNKPHNKVQENEHCCFAHQREWKTNPLTLITFYQASRLGGCTPSYVFAYTSVRDLFIWGGYLPCRKDYKVMVFYM